MFNFLELQEIIIKRLEEQSVQQEVNVNVVSVTNPEDVKTPKYPAIAVTYAGFQPSEKKGISQSFEIYYFLCVCVRSGKQDNGVTLRNEAGKIFSLIFESLVGFHPGAGWSQIEIMSGGAPELGPKDGFFPVIVKSKTQYKGNR